MTIETRTRKVAAKKVTVEITSRLRSKGGFYVWYPVDDGGKMLQGCHVARTKLEALQFLLAKVRCHAGIEFRITTRPPHHRDR